MATEHVLHKYNIVDPSIASLTSKPAKLVCQLYEKYGAREPGTAHLPPGTSTNSAKDQRRSSRYLFTAALKISFASIQTCVCIVSCNPQMRLKGQELQSAEYMRLGGLNK